MGFKDLGKVAMWKMKGMSQEQMAQELMKEPAAQEMFAKIQQGLASGAISKDDLMALQSKVMANPKEAQKELDELLGKIEK